MTATETPTMPQDRTKPMDGPTHLPTHDDACTACGGPLRADRTGVRCPGYVGSAGVCWDCHLERTEGAGAGRNTSGRIRDLVGGSLGIEAMCHDERAVGLDDDLSGGCYLDVLTQERPRSRWATKSRLMKAIWQKERKAMGVVPEQLSACIDVDGESLA